MQAIRSLVPVKSILKNLVNQEETKETKETDKEDSDDEDIAVKPQAESESQPLAPLVPLAPLESQPKSILSTVKNALILLNQIYKRFNLKCKMDLICHWLN